MAASVETTNYRYESLVDPRTHVRLLQISSIDEARDVPVHCQLTAWPVEATPAYTAISYTWGDPKLLDSILVDGKKMEVRQNCGYVLRQVWRLKGSGYVWIDAICINQADNEEKSPQVAMMGSIYQRAIQTLACVGRHENDSQFLYEMLHKKSHWWNQEAYGLLCFRFRRAHLWGLLLRNTMKTRLLKAFTSFMGRRYFRRVWVYQELVLGRDIHICCENENIQASKFWQISGALHTWSEHRKTMLRCSDAYLQQFHDQSPRIDDMLLAIVSNRFSRQFAVTIHTVSELQCEDPRDRVYGALAVVDWDGMQPIEPDYSMDKFDLALEVLQRIKEGSGFEVWLWKTLLIARSLHLTENSSEELDDAIRERLTVGSPNIITNPHGPDEILNPKLHRFWGTRLQFNNATWEFSRNNGSPATGSSGFQLEDPFKSAQESFPIIQQWSEGSAMDLTQAYILLPHDVQAQDLMLVSCPSEYDKEKSLTNHIYPGFLARKVGGHPLRLVGKLLILRGRLWPRVGAWRKLWENKMVSYKYGVHLDPEDSLLLAYSFNWKSPWSLFFESGEERRKLTEKYFETKLCGSKSCSYVVPMDC